MRCHSKFKVKIAALFFFLWFTVFFSGLTFLVFPNTGVIVQINGQESEASVDTTEKTSKSGSKLKMLPHDTSGQVFQFPDSLITGPVISDSLMVGPVLPDSLEIFLSPDSLDASVRYKSVDSLVYDVAGRKAFLYKTAETNYKAITLKADYIEFDWNTGTITAEGLTDSLGKETGRPHFSEGENEYRADKIMYNFKSKKGKVYNVKTKEGEGFLHGEEVKKFGEEAWYGRSAKYTTCDLDHPHFYIRASKVKMIPDKMMVSGPANLVVEEIPTPLYIPFGLFPMNKGRRSGIILPKYGDAQNRGFFLQDGGYYFGMSDYVDLALTGDIYSRGDWILRANSNYKLRYKFGGNFGVFFGRSGIGERGLPSFTSRRDFRVNWAHTQDTKSRPGISFSSNVNFGSSSYDKNFSVDADRFLQNTLASSINFGKSWAGKPYNFTAAIRHDQNLNTNQVNLTLPELSFNVTRIFPFKAKNNFGQKKWYEKISFSYTAQARNQMAGIDSTFFSGETFRNARYGLRHNIPITTDIALLKHLSLKPTFNYTERWYPQTIHRTWSPTQLTPKPNEPGFDTIPGMVITDTLMGFYQARDFLASLALSTKLIGIFNFKRGKLKAFRHVFTPTISYEYRPDFGKPGWGVMRSVQTDDAGTIAEYNRFAVVQSVYGSPPIGEYGGVRLTLGNNIEMKVFSKKDTVKNEKKVRVLDRLAVSTFYNFAKDQNHLDPISISGATTLFNNININFNANYDAYAADTNNYLMRSPRWEWETNKRLARLTSANIGLSGNFSAKRREPMQTTRGAPEEQEMVLNNPDWFWDFHVPWRVNFGYNLNLTKGSVTNPDTLQMTQSFTLGGEVNITPNWRLNVTTGYDFINKQLTYTTMDITRDLHCWELKFNWIPFPRERQRYAIQVNVKSAVLQDLKLSKRSNWIEAGF